MSEMTESSIAAARRYIAENWSGVPAVRICEAVLDLIENASPEEIGFKDLAAAAGLDEINGDVIVAANILSNSRHPVLEPAFHYLDDEANMRLVPREELEEYVPGMPDPASGRPIADPETRLYPFFRVMISPSPAPAI